jgi:hypothetical protein
LKSVLALPTRRVNPTNPEGFRGCSTAELPWLVSGDKVQSPVLSVNAVSETPT